MYETFGIGAIALALITLLTKVWLDSTRQSDKIIDTIKDSSITSTKLQNSLDNLTNLIYKIIQEKNA